MVADQAIVDEGELPPTWGLLAHKSGKLACIVNAAKLDAAPLDRLFLAAILRSVCDGMVSRDSIQDEVNKAAATAADAARAETKYEVDRAKEKVKEANQWLEQLREKTGIDLDKWVLSGYCVAKPACRLATHCQKDSLGGAMSTIQVNELASQSSSLLVQPSVEVRNFRRQRFHFINKQIEITILRDGNVNLFQLLEFDFR